MQSQRQIPAKENSMIPFKKLVLVSLAGGWLLVGCSKPAPQPEQTTPAAAEPAPAVMPAPEPGAASSYAAKTLFQSKCVVCHGSSGAGDGPGAAALNPKPRAFADGAWQTSVTDEQIENVILMGGAAAGKSPAMPGNPDLQAKPELVKELVKLVRGYKKG